MAKKPTKKQAILEYAKNNPMATPPEVAKACGSHPTYTYITMRNANAKKPKAAKPDFEFKRKNYEDMMLQTVKDLVSENDGLKDDITRLCGVVEYLETKLHHATSI